MAMENRSLHNTLDNKHSIGSMEDIMEILQVTREGSMMNTLERFDTYVCVCVYIYVYIHIKWNKT
jgi:hypothetical protein